MSSTEMTALPGPGSSGFNNVTAAQLQKLVEKAFDCKCRDDVIREVQPKLEELGNKGGLCEALRTNGMTGIVGSDVAERVRVFGENRLPKEEPESLLSLMIGALGDPTLILLIISASISIVLGEIFECKTTGWIEGFAILVAVAVVDVVASVNDWQKDKQFQALNAIKDAIEVAVIRDGKQQLVSVYNVVVGDILELSVGDILCADGLYLSGNDLKVNEASLTGESDDMKKGEFAFSEDGKNITSAPFLYGGTKVMEGNARMVVIAVGVSSYAGSSARLMQMEEDEESVLQKQLNQMTKQITVAGSIAAGIVISVLIVRMIIDFGMKNEGYHSWDNSRHPRELLSFFITAITVLVVAIPEGLPLAVTISLAFSVKKMLKDQNLVRHLSACETMGGATTICSDKTGTLTMNRMTVMKAYVHNAGQDMFSDQAGTGIPESLRKMLQAAIALNSSARLTFPVSGPPEHIGNKTECALLQFLHSMGLTYEESRAQNVSSLLKIYNFSSLRKRMSTLYNDGREIRLYSKGAPEILLERCSTIMDSATGVAVPLTPHLREHLINDVINSFAQECLRTLCIAERKMPASYHTDFEEPENIEKDLTCLALVGIEDPVRPEVPIALHKCRLAGITVRMVTGDNIVTATSISKKCGIAGQLENFIAMEGPTFRQIVTDPETGDVNQAAIDKIWPNLLVLARSSPKDKHMLVSGIMASNVGTKQIVAVTGDGTNDGPALKKAHVGFAMGITGTSVAKEAADIIIMDDNFSSIVSAVKWGRCVYDNICKFLQFQLTVNIVAITVAVVGACVVKISPLKAIQLLWVNLIMDSLASLALATEGPGEDLLMRKPYGRDRPLLSPTMLRNMFLHAAYQLGIMFYLIWGIDKHLGIENGVPDPNAPGGCDHNDVTVHFTIVFNAFVLMQLFNEINSRRINNEVNVFWGLYKNIYFVGVLFITCVLQAILIEFGGVAFETHHLDWSQWLICIAIGAFEIPLYQLIRFVPVSYFEPMSRLFSIKCDDGEKTPSVVDLAETPIAVAVIPSSVGANNGDNGSRLPSAASSYKLVAPHGQTTVTDSSPSLPTIPTVKIPVKAADDDLEVLHAGQLTPTPPDPDSAINTNFPSTPGYVEENRMHSSPDGSSQIFS